MFFEFLHSPFRPQTATLQTAVFKILPVAFSTSFHEVPARFSGIKQVGSPGIRPSPPTQADVEEVVVEVGVGVGAGSGNPPLIRASVALSALL